MLALVYVNYIAIIKIMASQKRNRVFVIGALICTLFVIGAFTYCAIHFFCNSSPSSQIDYFRYFTNLSNLLMYIVEIITIPFIIINLVKGRDHYPLWLRITQFISVMSVTLTMLTVLLFLGPTQGYAYMLQSDMIFMHLLNPLFALIGFVVFMSNEPFEWPFSFLGGSTTVVYGLVYTIKVLGTQEWEDFYGFNQSGLGVLIYFVMVFATVIMSVAFYYLQIWVKKKIRK